MIGMSETPKSSPHGPKSFVSETAIVPRSTRQRRADNDGRPDRVAELAADLEAYAQAARWSLPVAWAIYFHDDSDIAVELSGDHRPFRHAVLTVIL